MGLLEAECLDLSFFQQSWENFVSLFDVDHVLLLKIFDKSKPFLTHHIECEIIHFVFLLEIESYCLKNFE